MDVPTQQSADPDETFRILPHDTKLLALTLAELLTRTSAESKYHLQTALGARMFGVGGDLVVHVPRRSNEHVVIQWVGGGLVSLLGIAVG